MMRKWLAIGLWTMMAAGLNAEPIPSEVESLHADMWKRFVQPNGLLLDFNTLEGNVEMPTAEECTEGKPNALSWWTPIENGPFFTGLYLDAIVRRWKLTGREEDRAKAKQLADGLILSASVSDVPGFIARGVLPDGKSHYALGSDDQSGPWFYGLWRYVRSGAATEEEKKRVVKKLVDVAEALRGNRWLLPCDPLGSIKPNQYRGSFSDAEYRAATRLLFVTRMLFELTGDKTWEQAYEEALTATMRNGKSRMEYITDGIPGYFREYPGMAKNQLWLFINSQGALRELVDLEKRPEIRDKYLAALRLNAKTVMASVTDAPPAGLESLVYKTDWRSMNAMWRAQSTGDEASKLALEQLSWWKNQGRNVEIPGVREPFCAAAIVFLAPDRDPQTVAAAVRFQKFLKQVPWSKLYSSYGLFAELAWYAMQETPMDLSTAATAVAPAVTPVAPSATTTVEVLRDGGNRCTGKYEFKEIPSELQGKKIYTVPRGELSRPGAGYTVKSRATGTAWLLVMNKGKQELGSVWELTSLQTSWEAGGNTQRDKVYRRQVKAGEEIVVPAAEALQHGSYSIPHALVLED